MFRNKEATMPQPYARTILVRPEFSMVELNVPAGEGPPPHTHTRETEEFIVLQGVFEFYMGNKLPIKLSAGDRLTGPTGIQHHFRNVGESPGQLILCFMPPGCERYFEKLEAERAKPGPDLRERICNLDEQFGIIIDREK
ncbi:MAG: cupin domain-containing protein [Candidatus Doudnabacteria bacterium]|nr:cupin domain-containing protein [Candidatus Doudnabacteria bacterium]